MDAGDLLGRVDSAARAATKAGEPHAMALAYEETLRAVFGFLDASLVHLRIEHWEVTLELLPRLRGMEALGGFAVADRHILAPLG